MLQGSQGKELRGIHLQDTSAHGMKIAVCKNLVKGIREAVQPAGGEVFLERKSTIICVDKKLPITVFSSCGKISTRGGSNKRIGWNFSSNLISG